MNVVGSMEKEFLEEKYWEEGLTQEEIGKLVGLSKGTVGYWMNKFDIPTRSKAKVGELASRSWQKTPDLSSSEVLVYIVGVIKGDGSVGDVGKGNYQISLQTHNKRFNESFEEALEEIGLNARTYEQTRKRKKGDGGFLNGKITYYQTISLSKKFVNWYESLNINDIEKLAKEYPQNFLRGFYESEGWLSDYIYKKPKRNGYGPYNYRRIRGGMACTDKRILRLCKEMIESIGISVSKISIKNARREKKLYQIEISGENMEKFIDEVSPCIKKG